HTSSPRAEAAVAPTSAAELQRERDRPITDTAGRELVEGRAAESSTATVVPRLRPDAAKHVETLSPASATDTDAEAMAGWAAYQRGDVESAPESLSRAASRATAHPWVFYALGQSDYALGHFVPAVAAWERVRSTTPEFKPVYFDLVDAYLQIKDYDKATRVLRDGERRWRRDAELLNALGVVHVTRR